MNKLIRLLISCFLILIALHDTAPALDIDIDDNDKVDVAFGGTNTATAPANQVFAGPTSGGASTPSFRALDPTDLPAGTTQASTDETTDIATNEFVQMLNGPGSNFVEDPDFRKQVSGMSYWTTIDVVSATAPTYGAFGYGTRKGAKFTFASDQYVGVDSLKHYPCKAGQTFYLGIGGYLSSDYDDDQNAGLQLQLNVYDSSDSYLETVGIYSTEDTLGAWILTEGNVTISETNAQYFTISSYIYDSGSSGSGYAQVDYISIILVDGPFLTLTGDGRELQLEHGGCSSGTCTATEILKDQITDFGTGLKDLSDATVLLPAGGSYYADENVAPTLPGQLKYDNTVTGIDDGAISWYDDDEVKYLVGIATLPTETGQVDIYNATTDKYVPGHHNGITTNSKSAAYTVGTDDPDECYGGTIYVTSAAVITACDNLAADMSFSVVTIGAIAVSADVQSDDKMILDGTALDDGDKATNTSTAGDTIFCQYYSTDGWYCWSGSPDGDHWTDGGA